MRPDRRDPSAARPKWGPLLSAGPWLRRGWNWTRKPKTRLRPAGKPIDVAFNSASSVIIFHDGWYYLLVTDSSCNIRIGRSRKVIGPFVDNMGIDMLQDGEKLLL